MRQRLLTRVQDLLDGFWFVPGVVALGLTSLGVVLVEIDRRVGGDGAGLFPGDAQAARVVLSVVAGSLITVAGLSFSITIVTLQLVSAQYSPRALQSLLGDRMNQVIAGAFVGIFGYCLLVLRSVRDDFVPSLAVTVAIVLGLVGLALVLAFVHHVGQSIKVDKICARVARQTLAAADRLYPEPYGTPAAVPVPLEGPAGPLHANGYGWLRVVDVERLAACHPQARSIEVIVRPGDFVTPARTVAEVRPPTAASEAAAAAFVIAPERDLAQDIGFGIRQLVDIALRALSPSLNDPTTAVTCVGYLGVILERMAERGDPVADRRVGEHGLLLRTSVATFASFLEDAFVEIVRHGREEPRVLAAVHDALERVGGVASAVGADDRLASARALSRS